jgi:hypothetical protein
MLIMMKSNLLSICFIRAVALALIASLHLTAIAQASNNQPGLQGPQISSANRIASPIKTWPVPGSPMELLPKIEFQPLTDEDMRNALALYSAYVKQEPATTWDDAKKQWCLTKFWRNKSDVNENPFMITFISGRDGYTKLNGYIARVKSWTFGSKFGAIGEYGKGELESIEILPIDKKRQPDERSVLLELRKTSQNNCSFFNFHCVKYNAEAYLYWGSFTNAALPVEGFRQDFSSVYIEDRCYRNEFKTQLFHHRYKPNILERFVGFFFALS